MRLNPGLLGSGTPGCRKTVTVVSYAALAGGTDVIDATVNMLSTISDTIMLAIIFLLNSFHYSFTKSLYAFAFRLYNGLGQRLLIKG